MPVSVPGPVPVPVGNRRNQTGLLLYTRLLLPSRTPPVSGTSRVSCYISMPGMWGASRVRADPPFDGANDAGGIDTRGVFTSAPALQLPYGPP